MPPLSPPADTFVPTIEIAVNHAPLPPTTAKLIVDLSVTQLLEPPNSFSFRLNDPTLELIDPRLGIFKEGSRVEISLGYVGNTTKLLVGEIAALSLDLPSDGPATAQVEGFDLLHRLHRGTTYRTFEGPTPGSGLADSEIVIQLAAEMDLQAQVDATAARTEPRTQLYVSDLAFLEELARANGFFFWVDGDTLFFKQQRPAPGTVKLERGKTLLSFAPRLSTVNQVHSVFVQGWDPVQKQSVFGLAERSPAELSPPRLAGTIHRHLFRSAGGSSSLRIFDAPVASAQEAQSYAEALLADLRQRLITASGSCLGNPAVVVGTLLDVSGVGRFEGTYVVEQASHTVGSSGYETSFQVRSQA
jgi:phage protein D